MAQNLNGVQVRHNEYGVGRIRAHNGDNFQVVFNTGYEFTFNVNTLNNTIYGFDTNAQIKISGFQKNIKKNVIQSARIRAIREILRKRDIKYLVHFTRAENLSSIEKYGLLPLDELENKKIAYIQNDEKRLDHTKAICMTITRPNWPLFQKFRHDANNTADWVALKLDAVKVLTECECRFCPVNAATDGGAHIQWKLTDNADDFDRLFKRKDSVENFLPENWTTDPQAEVLVISSIPKEFITDFILNPTYNQILATEKYVTSDSYVWKNQTSQKTKNCRVIYGKIECDDIVIVYGEDNINIEANFENIMRQKIGFTGEFTRSHKTCSDNSVFDETSVVIFDEDILLKKFDSINVDGRYISVKYIVEKYAPICI